MANVGIITKSLLAAVGSVATVVIAAGLAAQQNDGRIDGLEWLGLVAALLTGLAVWAKRNNISGVGYWWKSVITAAGGIVAALITSLAGNEGRSITELFGDMTFEQWLLLVVSPAINALLVAVAPNAAESDDPPQPGGDPEPDNEDDDTFEDFDPSELPSDDPADHPATENGTI